MTAAIITLIEHSVSGEWWFIPSKFRPEAGQIRRKTVFLWCPKTIKGIRRWWERAEIVQVYSGAGSMTGHDWNPAGWINLDWGEFVESIEVEQPRMHLFGGSPRGNILPKRRDGILVVFDEKYLR